MADIRLKYFNLSSTYVGYYAQVPQVLVLFDVISSMKNQMVFHTSSPSLVAVLIRNGFFLCVSRCKAVSAHDECDEQGLHYDIAVGNAAMRSDRSNL